MPLAKSHLSDANRPKVYFTSPLIIYKSLGTFLTSISFSFCLARRRQCVGLSNGAPMNRVLLHTVLLVLASASQALDCESAQCDATQDNIIVAAVAQENSLNRPAKFKKPLPHWTVTATQDVFSDQVLVSVSTPASNPVKCRWGTKIPTLVMECRDNQTIARFETHCRISTSDFDDYGDVTYRVDKSDVKTLRFSESVDNRSMGLWESEDSVPFIQSLMDSEILAAKIKPYSDEPFVAFFDTTGLSDAIAPIQSACGWDSLDLSN